MVAAIACPLALPMHVRREADHRRDGVARDGAPGPGSLPVLQRGQAPLARTCAVSTSDTVVPFPCASPRQAAQRRLEEAREQHLAALEAWLREDVPRRDDAELEVEVFSATARQLVLRHTRGGN